MAHVRRTSGTLSVRLARLERAGYVTRERDPDDRRGAVVSLTDRGRERVEAARPAYDETAARLAAGLPDDERARVRRAPGPLARVLRARRPRRPAPRRRRRARGGRAAHAPRGRAARAPRDPRPEGPSRQRGRGRGPGARRPRRRRRRRRRPHDRRPAPRARPRERDASRSPSSAGSTSAPSTSRSTRRPEPRRLIGSGARRVSRRALRLLVVSRSSSGRRRRRAASSPGSSAADPARRRRGPAGSSGGGDRRPSCRRRPWSQPRMTWPWPSVSWNGALPRFQEESNSLSLLKSVADVAHRQLVAGLRRGALALDEVLDLERRRRGARGLRDLRLGGDVRLARGWA